MLYTKQEIFQILLNNYHLGEAFDAEVEQNVSINSKMTLVEWRDVNNFAKPKILAKYLHQVFVLDGTPDELEETLIQEQDKTLDDLCDYLSQHASYPSIKPISIAGHHSEIVSIFLALKKELSQQGIATLSLRPSSLLIPYFEKHGSDFIFTVNRFSPGILSRFAYQDNRWVVLGTNIIFFSLILLSILILISLFFPYATKSWVLVFIAPVIAGFLLIKKGKKLPPETFHIADYDDFRGLVSAIHRKLDSKSNF